MKLVITIGTEEYNWGCYSPTGHTLENIRGMPLLQNCAKPTHLINRRGYPRIDLLRSILHGAGAKRRPVPSWNTPPFQEELYGGS